MADNIPDEFAGFFETIEKDIEVIISGEESIVNTKAIVNFDRFTLLNSAENLAKLSDYLVRHRIKRTAASQIVEQLLIGVETASTCEGYVADCVPKDISKQAKYVFDYENNRLRIYVSSSMLDSRAENVEYYIGDRGDNALINNTNLFVQTTNSDSYFSWSNDTVLGAPYGYFRLNTNYQSSQNNFDVYDIYYNADYENIRLKLGYQGYGSSSTFNSTDNLTSDMNLTGKYISFGSSSNLLKRKSDGVQRIYYFAPQAGQLEVFRGERLIITRGVTEGEHSINYNELPSGAYDIKLVLRRGDKTIFEDKRFVVNTSNYSLAVGDYDYKLDIRMLDPSTSVNEQLRESLVVASAVSSYRSSESLLLSVGAGVGQDDQYAQFGLSKVFLDSINVNYVSSYFSSGAIYQQFAARLNDVSIALKYTSNDEDKINQSSKNNLSTILYGENDRLEYSVNWAHFLFGGNINLGYSHFSYSEQNQSSNVLNFSWSRPLLGGEVSLSCAYNKYANTNSLNALVTWSYDLGGDYRTSTSAGFSIEGLSSVRTDISRSLYGDDWYASGSLAAISNSVNRRGELSMTGNIRRDTFNYNGFVYGTTLGEYSVSGSMSGTQFITANHRGMTDKHSNAFILIEPEWQEKGKDGELSYTILKGNRIWRTNTLKEGDVALLDVNDYAEIEVQLDSEYQNLEIEYNVDKKITMPGSVYVFGGKVTQLQSQVLVISDMFGQPVSDVDCIGTGCRSVEMVSEDGVFRVNYLIAEPFKIVSGNRLCVYDTKAFGQTYLQSYCLVGLDALPSETNVIKDVEANKLQTVTQDKFVYIGKYNSSLEVEAILTKLKEVNLISHNVQVGDELYVYVIREEEYTLAQQHLLDSLETYAINDDAAK
ncbi:TcfC E-set like domain-containing protein [Photobacterium leiognathi]|uniref:TcfC E-set like domain-containing protein n=1 Tax=Photobacterium leiognathi TaxID=553611 RepID=UPI00273A26E6|nr:TcfC E-set like domain-containing protein [Photobacterium leiognathi]